MKKIHEGFAFFLHIIQTLFATHFLLFFFPTFLLSKELITFPLLLSQN